MSVRVRPKGSLLEIEDRLDADAPKPAENGLDAVAIVALGSGADTSLVVAVQMLRLLAVVALGQVVGWWQNR